MLESYNRAQSIFENLNQDYNKKLASLSRNELLQENDGLRRKSIVQNQKHQNRRHLLQNHSGHEKHHVLIIIYRRFP